LGKRAPEAPIGATKLRIPAANASALFSVTP
jgi:hypothetical protein